VSPSGPGGTYSFGLRGAAGEAACARYGIAVAYSVLTFIESPQFSRLVYDYLDDDEYAELQTFLAVNPEAGRLVRGSYLGQELRNVGEECHTGSRDLKFRECLLTSLEVLT